MKNIVLDTDSYKLCHWQMYPENTSQIFSYFEARKGGRYPSVVFFGLQYIIAKHLAGKVLNESMIDEAEDFCGAHFGDASLFNREGWEYVLKEYDGYLPVEIRAVPEGYIVPDGNVLFTVRNTDPKCAWLTNHLETLLVQCWYPSTVATSSMHQFLTIHKAARDSGMDASYENLNLKLHDFGFRGSTSHDSAGIGGAAHLIVFRGSDTIAACNTINEYYSEITDGKNPIAAISIPAAEHSTITAHDHEIEAYKQILDNYSFVSVVSDSYDYWTAIDQMWGGTLKEQVKQNMKDGKTLVIRPDSGDPAENVIKTLEILGSKFGIETNDKGFKTLPRGLNIIQGDGIDHDKLRLICNVLMLNKWTIDNVTFGSGGGLLQKVNRDTQRFAMKCSSAVINGKRKDVMKNPRTDKSKASKAGLLDLIFNGTDYKTVQCDEDNYPRTESVMHTAFYNGKAKELSFSDVRHNFLENLKLKFKVESADRERPA